MSDLRSTQGHPHISARFPSHRLIGHSHPFWIRPRIENGRATWATTFLIVLSVILPIPGQVIRADETPKSSFPSAAEYDAFVKESDRNHWSFQPVRASAPPEVKDRAWVRNPIDCFVLEKLESKGWRPNPPADAIPLVRRLSLDLTGLPVSLPEQEAFEQIVKTNDQQLVDEHLHRFIDDLLDRPAYGERWARHWLDLVRYAETNGYERDAKKPHAWRYRDYVIAAMNQDKPYDRFILEQLAGDELPDASSETVIATGFCRLGPWDDEPADPKEDRYEQLDDIVSTMAQTFLAQTIGCARCHNHKFEPFSMLDYYRLVAIFAPLKRPQAGRSDLDFPAGSPLQLQSQRERDGKIQKMQAEFQRRLDVLRVEFLRTNESKVTPELLTILLKSDAARNDEEKKLLQKNKSELENLDREVLNSVAEDQRRELQKYQLKEAELRKQQPDLPLGYFFTEPSSVAVPVTNVLLRGKSTSPGTIAEPGFPAVLHPSNQAVQTNGSQTSGRRLGLAKWLASPDHPLTARVFVNRVWQFHFGEGLVRTPSDFGVMGTSPTHPELLDWLANWFVHEANWSVKSLHRLILNSNTYRMSKTWRDDYGKLDPENRLFWAFPYRRIEVEPICDSILFVSGRLNRQMYGPSMYPHIPRHVLEGHSDPNIVWQAFHEDHASRRTVYTFIKRSLVVPMLEVLDLCDTTRSAAKRNVTSVATQALTMLNGDFVNRQAEHLASRLVRECGTDRDQQIQLALRLALCRRTSEKELQLFRDFLQSETARQTQQDSSLTAEQAQHRALVQFSRIVFNLNEFVYPN